MLCAAVLWRGAAADSLLLARGARLTGMVGRVDADGVELVSCGSRRMYLRTAVQSIEFNSASGVCPKGSMDAEEVAAGARLLVKLSRQIDPVRDPVGQVIGGSLEQPLSIGDRLLIRAGAPVLLQLQPALEARDAINAAGAAERRPMALHVTAVRLDSGWISLDATDEASRDIDGPGEPAAVAAGLPAKLSHVFTVRKSQAAVSAQHAIALQTELPSPPP